MNRILVYTLFFILPIFTFAQANSGGKVIDEVTAARSTGETFPTTELFTNLSSSELNRMASRNLDVRNATFFSYQKSSDFENKARSNNSLSLKIPFKENGEILDLSLIKVDIHSDDFISNVPYKSGYHYRGIVNGQPNSLASISIFDGEVVGFINLSGNTYTLGKLKNDESIHLLYNEFSQGWGLETNCNTDDERISYDPAEMINQSGERSPGDCIRQKFEVDESLTNEVGGEAAGIAYGTGVFNNQKTLYANDGINVVLSELKVWTTNDPAPYVIDGYNTLDSYRALTGSYNGDVAYLGFYQGGWNGGVASAIGGICQNNVDDTKAIGGHLGFYQDVPVYTHDVLIISHEMGHIFGARHTHACVWNGNNTAIDGCAGFTEGGCSIPPSINPGTIMSYCNTSDFNEGFHPQVAQAIQNYIASRTCTSPCNSDPTCDDGIQNGNETGVDCGGPDCDPCEVVPTCNDGIQNGDETGVDCGGPDCDPCEVVPTCNDGIQNGDETGVDCGGPDCDPCEVAPTCNDGIQNGDETGVDCGGSCPDCEPTDCNQNEVQLVLILDNYPEETSWEITNQSNQVVASSNGTYANEADGTTLNISECLSDGCYKFTINDTYGDGICCNYGAGSYTLYDESGNALASGGEFTFSESTEFCLGESTDPEYCESQGEDTSYEWIERVVFGSIDKTSGNNLGYADFTNLSTALNPGGNVSVTLYPGFSGNSYTEYWRIWIDYNQDGDFEDQDELIGAGNGNGVLSGNLNISSSAQPGTTRMRVSMQYNQAPSACGEFQYGEVEDYTVNIGNSFAANSQRSNPKDLIAENGTASPSLTIFPNPSYRDITLTYHTRIAGETKIKISDQMGKVVYSTRNISVEGRNELLLDVSNVPPGVYIVQLEGMRYQAAEKLIITK